MLIDLGMPRNIDPQLGRSCEKLKIVDLDVLKNWYRANTGALDQVREICAAITEDHRSNYEHIRDSMQGEI